MNNKESKSKVTTLSCACKSLRSLSKVILPSVPSATCLTRNAAINRAFFSVETPFAKTVLKKLVRVTHSPALYAILHTHSQSRATAILLLTTST